MNTAFMAIVAKFQHAPKKLRAAHNPAEPAGS
eukprot:CAMPEP_0172872660 /NCGR_PEP_ID=MMETSP1075-20121228/92760_1 /TAXON_ID=2916 /ORGANISM="Ceratium fusus, Strain PA161109" /LENGTH=31 /DNA_ID= /DNA_START= /DNA_END= /DNA_ORIENTATION=